MEYKELIDERSNDFQEAVEHVIGEFGKLRTGRANASLVEDIRVDYYGSKTPLKQVATVSVPEPRQITIAPWSVDSLANIEAAIKLANLGVSASNDGKVIRLTLPQLTEERRKELVKVAGKKAEEAKISIRTIREDVWNKIQDYTKNGEIAEDDKFRAKEELQEVVDTFNKKVEQLRQKKEEEIMTI
ncbi:MAG: ribosome recycling factor [Candidatus Moranbacteria bacterium]|nr:ribosome recycling factor [Candidatus Moranbacteria bacterium]